MYKLGFEVKMYVGTAGTAPSGECSTITDLSVDLSRDAVDATTRQSGKFKTYVPGLIDAGLSFSMPADSSDTNLTTLRGAWIAGTAVAVKIELGDGYAFQSDMIVSSCKNGQNNGELVKYDFELKPTITISTFLPQFVELTSGGTGGGGGQSQQTPT